MTTYTNLSASTVDTILSYAVSHSFKEFGGGFGVVGFFGLGALQGGPMWKFTFRNGYTASVVKHCGSYGSEQDLWEIAVMRDGELCYDTPITNDVLGYQSESDVMDICKQIAELDNPDSSD